MTSENLLPPSVFGITKQHHKNFIDPNGGAIQIHRLTCHTIEKINPSRNEKIEGTQLKTFFFLSDTINDFGKPRKNNLCPKAKIEGK